MRLRVASRMPGLGLRCRVPRLGDMSDLHVWMLARHSSFAAYSDLLSLFTVGGGGEAGKHPRADPPCRRHKRYQDNAAFPRSTFGTSPRAALQTNDTKTN